MAPPPLDTQFDSETKIWSGPAEDHDKSLQLGAYLLNVLKNAKNPEKILQVGIHFTFLLDRICFTRNVDPFVDILRYWRRNDCQRNVSEKCSIGFASTKIGRSAWRRCFNNIADFIYNDTAIGRIAGYWSHR